MTTHLRVARLWTGTAWHSDAAVAVDDQGIRPAPASASTAAFLDATLLPPLTDAHVHIGLSDFADHGGRGLARVLDLGWGPGLPSSSDTTDVRFAGPFLTAPGGYPSTRPWAPSDSVRSVTDCDDARVAVQEVQALGASVVKLTLNSDVGPVLPDDSLRAIVEAAHESGLRVVAHVEGQGQPERAVAAGVDWFAHTPWTHTLPDHSLRTMAGATGWISTLDMHGRGRYGKDYEAAVENLRRFVALGGTVIYGTDLGNAITRSDVNLREVAALREAGLPSSQLLQALSGAPLLPTWSRTATLLPGRIGDAEEALSVLATARPVDAAALQELAT